MTGCPLVLVLALLINHPTSVKFHGTARLPKASGEAKVERVAGGPKIDIELDEMKPASLFGGDFNTYVLWIVSPEGLARNAGEIVLEGNRSKISVPGGAGDFEMFITAEPHYLVDIPSRFQVLEPERVSVPYTGLRGIYNYARDKLEDAKEAKGPVQNNVKQAFTAVQLAQRADAHELAKDEWIRARSSLLATLTLSEKGMDRHKVDSLARETVRLAFAAQKLAEGRRRTISQYKGVES